MPVEKRLNAYREVVDRHLDRILPNPEKAPHELHAAMRYSCLAPGKRLRPALCLASAEAVGGSLDEQGAVVDAACAVELVHCFSLIHDDLPCIDDDDLRRGAPTCHVKFGEALALLAGDALFALAFDVLSSARAPAARVNASVRSLAKAAGSDGLVGGEVLDVVAEGLPVEEDTLRTIHSLKTGALIAASCEVGGILGGGTGKQRTALRSFGARVGLAFQIVDDVLNEVSTGEKLGKAVGSDRDRRKATYPALLGVSGAKREAERLIDAAIEGLEATKLTEALAELARYSVTRLH